MARRTTPGKRIPKAAIVQGPFDDDVVEKIIKTYVEALRLQQWKIKWVWVHYEDWDNFAQIKPAPRHEARMLLNDQASDLEELKGSIAHELVHLHLWRIYELVETVAENELEPRRGASLLSDLSKAIEYPCEDIAQMVVSAVPCEV